METTTSSQEKIPASGFWQRNTLSVKIILIGILILLLFIPLSMIRSLIAERSERADEAIGEVQHKWSNAQQLIGPFISLPFYETKQETYFEGNSQKTHTRTMTNSLHILPETLKIEGDIQTEQLKRGLYDIVVYKAPLELHGTFVLPPHFNQEVRDKGLLLSQATLNLGLSDLRGLSEQIQVEWGDETLDFEPGLPEELPISSGVSTFLSATSKLQSGDTIPFRIRLYLKGSASLNIAPFGKTTTVNLTSNSTTPSFNGDFLPEERNIDEKGFTAQWKILHLNRNYPQVFTTTQIMGKEKFNFFGVNLLLPVRQYQQSMRTVKYASLIIILTFVISFFTEIIQKRNIHPFQYLLIGLALCLFYTLLIAISEHIGFTWSYLISALMTISLLTAYMYGILKIRKTALTMGSLLALLYGYIFILTRMETYALLAGSLGLFVILAFVMYYSQKIDWSGRNNPLLRSSHS